jgi:hypothetical protein
MGCAECCDCWCYFAFTNPDGRDGDDAEALRGEIRKLEMERSSCTCGLMSGSAANARPWGATLFGNSGTITSGR